MRYALLGAALAAISMGSAAAGQPGASPEPSARKAAPLLYVCDRSDLTRRSFVRQYGAMEFVTAQAVVAHPSWEGARCITDAEYRRLGRLRSVNIRTASLR